MSFPKAEDRAPGVASGGGVAADGAPDQGSYIQVRGLSKGYGDVLALNDVSISAEEGEFLVLLGPSGCGKTTLMRCVAGLETPEHGQIVVGGRPYFNRAQGADVPVHRRQIGMVFQSYAIWPHKTVYGNVAFPLQMKRLPKQEIREQVDEALELVGLSGFGDRPASRLSGGQMQRVALARSLVLRPRVLLLDEPLSNLDAQLRERLRFELKQIQQDTGVTTIYVTHDQTEALAVADRITLMCGGEVAQTADPFTLYKRPMTAFAADFLGSANLYDAEVIATGAQGHELRLLEAERRLMARDVTAASRDGGVESGTCGVACIRPEDVLVAAPSAGMDDRVTTWSATVVTASFLGTHLRYRLRLADGPMLEAICRADSEFFPAGTAVSAGLDPDLVRLLPGRVGDAPTPPA